MTGENVQSGRISPIHTMIAGVLFALGLAFLVFHFTLERPWMGLGLRFDKISGGAIVRSARGPSLAIPAGTVLTKMSAAGDSLEFTDLDFVAEPDGGMGTYQIYYGFLKRQDRFAQMQDSPEVTLTSKDGTAWKIQPLESRPLWSLPVEFWIQFVVGVLAWMISVSVWALRPREGGVRYLLLSGFGMIVSAQLAAIYTTRELAIHSQVFWWIDGLNFFGGSLFAASLVALLLYYPRKIAPRWVGWAFILINVVWYILQDQDVVESMTDARRILVLISILTTFVLSGVHWFKTRKDPVARAALQWFLLSWVAAAGIFSSVLFIPQLFGIDTSALQSYLFTLFLLMYVGLSFGILRFRLFGLGEWWYRIVFWVMAMLVLVVLDLVFLLGLKLSNQVSLSAALLICGIFWFPLRAVLQSWLMPRPAQWSVNFKRVVDIALAPPGPSQTNAYVGLLKEFFNPLNLQISETLVKRVELHQHGQALVVPATLGLPAIRMEFAYGGQRLFSPRDVASIEELIEMLQYTHDTKNAYQKGVSEERLRVAQDLHDDVGARLLTGLHSEESDLRATIQGAIADIRSIVKGIAGQEVKVCDLFADLRAESAQRLGAVGIVLEWPADSYGRQQQVIGYRHHKAIGSVVREVISNTIRHSRSTNLAVEATVDGGKLRFTFRDDGHGFPDRVLQGETGFGLKGIKKRILDLGGEFRFENSPKGAGIYITLPV